MFQNMYYTHWMPPEFKKKYQAFIKAGNELALAAEKLSNIEIIEKE